MPKPIPKRFCDIVMKGGITSGVVYPLAIVELAEEFRFKNIGGTSAGAIAAALTAAAEYRRVSTGLGGGFDELRKLPDFLAGKTDGQPNLLNLFPPTRPTRRLFGLTTAFLERGSMATKAVRALIRLIMISPLASLAASLPALVAPFLLARDTWLEWAGLVGVELVLLAAGLLFLTLFVAIDAARTLPGNGFGFSTGMAPDDRRLPGVSQWLHDTIQRTAGRAENDAPLTFGDLWTAGTPPEERAEAAERCENGSDLRSIELQMMTTALSHGRPYRLPFDNRRFSFREAELRSYFPAVVVDHLVAKAGPPSEPGLYPLPPARDVPIVVAARMSLSFPVLFAMVPLYAVDYTSKRNQTGSPQPERCWFIDGGLCSNFPVSLFDTPFPRWPTFGIDLADFHPDYPKDDRNEANNVWMVQGNGDGTSDHWRRFPTTGLEAVGGYVGAILDVIRNWRDNSQLTVPGFRDRIVHVKLSPDEGGLNLTMEDEKVRSLSKRGRFAAVLLRERFGAAGAARDGLNWNTHRWVRYKTSMALLQEAMQRMDAAFSTTDPGYPGYPDLVERTADGNPSTGNWWKRDPRGYQVLTAAFLELARAAARTDVSFEHEAPRPRPELRITPRL